MSQNVSPSKPFYRRIFDTHSIFFYLLMTVFVIAILLAFASWVSGWVLWVVGLLVMAAWTPLVVSTTRAIYRRHNWFACLYLLLVTQIAHTFEHLAQMVEIHIIGIPARSANGIIGFLNVEWVHLAWNTMILLAVFMLLFTYRRNIWLWMLFVFAIYHEIEHVYMVAIYMQTGVPGDPGLLAKGGLVGGGLPISRPDLHSIYAVLEVLMLLIIYLEERKNIRHALAGQGGSAQLAIG